MTSKALPVPLANRRPTMPVVGHITMGDRGGKNNAPRTLPVWRVRSQVKTLCDQIAAKYGGKVTPFDDPKSDDKWQVTTETDVLKVALPPDPLGDTPSYLKFGGQGWERTCNGITCDTVQSGPEGPEAVEVPCLCLARDRMECAVTIRLAVIPLGVDFQGCFMVVTHSVRARDELPGMVAMLLSLQSRGMNVGLLRIARGRASNPFELDDKGRRQQYRFGYPALAADETPEALVAGASTLGALPAAATASVGASQRDAIEAGEATAPAAVDPPPRPERVTPDAVTPPPVAGGGGSEDSTTASEHPGTEQAPSAPSGTPASKDQRDTIRDLGEQLDGDDDKGPQHDAVKDWRRRNQIPAMSDRNLTDTQATAFMDACEQAIAGDPCANTTEWDTARKALMAKAADVFSTDPVKTRDAKRHAITLHVAGSESANDCTIDELKEVRAVLSDPDVIGCLHLRATGDYEVRAR